MLVIGDISRAHARRCPDKAALVMGEQIMSYAELDQQSNRLAHALIAEGVASDDRVALLGMNSIDYAVALHGIAKCGAIVVPLNFRLAAAEARQVLEDAEPAVLIAEPAFDALLHEALEGLARPPTRWTLCDDSGAGLAARLANQPADPVDCVVDPESAATLLFTSGTTGRAKGVLMSHAVIFRMFAATAIEARLTHDAVVLVAAPMFHLAGMNLALNQALYLGGTAVLHRGRFEVDAIFRLIERQRISLAVLVPTMVAAMAFDPQVGSFDLACLNKVFYGSAPITPVALAKAREVFAQVAFTQLYGSTECGMVAVLRPEDHQRWSQCTGREALLSRLRIVDESGADVAPGAVGEIIAEQRHIGMLGYWRNDAATREAIVDGWIRSGDLARVEADGVFTIVDRLKDVIISGGENLYPKEIEAAIAAHPAVAEVAVFGVPDEAYGESPCAAVVLRAGQQATAEALQAWCVQHLARYKRPRRFEFHAALPRNASDKVLKTALRAPHWQGRSRMI
ncbi:AMP-binding protein [Aquabacterium sp.]|uniref:AMP-binding protein n=1 Tax=Aquabacterium sp. TaxID=1872578 RepID=UPI002C16F91B|nr:AMP-binding protein [Aquabacterium sp.]HSW06546.1 AMP-binding protein [Aquabacterium sp.]